MVFGGEVAVVVVAGADLAEPAPGGVAQVGGELVAVGDVQGAAIGVIAVVVGGAAVGLFDGFEVAGGGLPVTDVALGVVVVSGDVVLTVVVGGEWAVDAFEPAVFLAVFAVVVAVLPGALVVLLVLIGGAIHGGAAFAVGAGEFSGVAGVYFGAIGEFSLRVVVHQGGALGLLSTGR